MSILNDFSLKGRTAVVTGGAGLFGRQIVEALAEAGATTFTASRNTEALSAEAAKLQDKGLDVHCKNLDQSQEDSIRNLIKDITTEKGKIDILVNNAVARPMTKYEDSFDTFEQSMKVNATGIWMMTRLFGDHMADNGKGSIINIGSIQGMVGPTLSLYEGMGWGVPPDYFFHKGGMVQLTKYAAAMLGNQGVRVNTLSPGGFFNEQGEPFVSRYNKSTFLGRMADNKDIKGAIVFLASDASAYVTGANLPVDGGYTAH